jgi:DmsE family decaheme c-type cytochrome
VKRTYLLSLLSSACATSIALAGVFAGRALAADPPGPEVCAGCHQPYVQSFTASVHGNKAQPGSPANSGGCFVCHGDGTEHVKAGGGRGVGGVRGFNNAAISAGEKAGTCLNCHAGNRQLAFWESGRHQKNEVSCNNCHSIHDQPQQRTDGPLLKKPNPSITPLVTVNRQLQYETCTACHKQIRSQLLKTSHHPIIEGKLKCTSCHNPHGALSHAMIKEESVNQLCTSCHADKRGPFMQEHPPVEENCLTCHNSHGSMHPKLLAERAPTLCQDCHDASRHPGTFYSGNQGFNSAASGAPNTRLIARGCVNCHTSIHGSNAPANRGKFFLR